VDISCIFCRGDGCRVCSHTGWLEVLGCGIVDPNVFKAVGYKDVSGYAFGLGVERFAMLLHRIPDLRMLFEGDLRLLELSLDDSYKNMVKQFYRPKRYK